MFMFSIQHANSNQDESTIRSLNQVLAEQRENLTTLCTIVEYLKGYGQTGLESKDVIKYNQKIQIMNDKQMNRYNKIDELINTNIFQIKKGKTTDNTAIVYGKEVRKIESGIRTLKLFVSDAINMLDPEQHLNNRSEERIQYFEKRSAAIEAEMITLAKIL
ncbi:chemotaxis protein [Solibacillus sp. MA9]|uniref:Chemotaxis protein n=1 Tax=Solibacillus palustris TaxID=2908203 RepID=A0ABS9UI00_9BACL|nr:chemotaxis protein [Solibacillus sp. MA9]MCH7323971.1 chemotaxis protein [Solibacillus sp. MA9]